MRSILELRHSSSSPISPARGAVWVWEEGSVGLSSSKLPLLLSWHQRCQASFHILLAACALMCCPHGVRGAAAAGLSQAGWDAEMAGGGMM